MDVSIGTMKMLAALSLLLAALAGGLLPFFLKERSKRAAAAAASGGGSASNDAAHSHGHGHGSASEKKSTKPRRRSVQYDEGVVVPGVSPPGMFSPPSPHVHVGAMSGAETTLTVRSPPPMLSTQHQEPEPAATASRRSASPVGISQYGAVSGSPGGLRSESFRARHPEAEKRSRRRSSATSGATAPSTAVSAVDPAAHPTTTSAKHHHRHGCCGHMDVDRFLSLGNMAGAGIFLGGGIMHLLPEAVEALREAQSSWAGALAPLKDFPVAFFLCGVGFFTILLVEEATIAITTASKNKKDAKALAEREEREERRKLEMPARMSAPTARRSKAPASVRVAGAAPTTASPSPSPSSPRDRIRLRGADKHYAAMLERSASPDFRRDHGRGDPTKRDLARNLVQGLTPRILLVPAVPIRKLKKRHKQQERLEQREASSARGPLASPLLPLLADDDGSSSLESEADEDGPIQQFLDAAYNSPSPFPSIADPLIARRLQRMQHDGNRSRRGSFPPDDSDSNMRGPTQQMMRGSGADSPTQSDWDSQGEQRSWASTPTNAPGSPAMPAKLSSRALSGNAALTRENSQETKLASPVSADATVTSTGSPAFAVPIPVTPLAVAAMRQPLLLEKSSFEFEPSASPPAFPSSSQLQAQHEDDQRVGSAFAPTTKSASGAASPRATARSERRSKRSEAADADHVHAHSHTHDDSVAPAAAHAHGGGSSHGHGHGGEDGHSHISLGHDTSYVVAYLLVLALSFHSIFEGIALGTQQAMSSTISIFIAILSHTPLAGFALGVSLVKARTSTRMSLSCLFLFAVMSPAGAMLGLLLSEFLSGDVLSTVSACFQSFSAGTFLFVALEEIIPKELASPKDKTIKLSLCVAGFIVMAAIKLFDTD